MGTRGLTGLVIDGRLLAQYNHMDSYPDYLGVKALEFCRGLASSPDGLREAIDKARELKVVDETVEPTEEEKFALKRWSGFSTGEDWYDTLRDTQGDYPAILDSGYILDSVHFGEDSLFCEWGYVVDLDNEKLEVYEGFRKNPPTAGRWVKEDVTEYVGDYYPIQLIATFDFDELPSNEEFLARVQAVTA